ncbi:hypothetical protein [Nonomuraea sp. C10]|uniref:hypothetical protein n=1 Tax=Nonomuraea sp. C10 TaxID=2600577 RepID=UPI0011CDED3D|nr:hypothetical protein [Nonomuraea sp. C10]TXK34028.1 hypothetical protein FR742_31960 [Nonomuraea sp. C10]
MKVTLATLEEQTGLTALDHLERSVRIPVVDGPQAQGDLIVIPLAMIAASVRIPPTAVAWEWIDVPVEGVDLLRGEAGGNTHTLVAEPYTCRWTRRLHDSERLAIGVFETTAPAYLLHPEHGATGCAPGTYVIRRQREQEGPRARLVAD